NQILINLIANAVKFTDNGEISLTVKKIIENNDENVLQFIVKDQGVGIPSDKIDEIFERFKQLDNGTTKKYQGTGLGLSIVKKLVNLLKGSIKVDSELNKGSSFVVELPFKIAKEIKKSNEEPKKSENININKTTMNILIAEDNAINALFLKELLEGEGYFVETAINGVKALEKISKKSYDLIFMDIQMPEMDGFTATKLLREKGVNIPIIALTAYSMKEDKEKCLKNGMDDYVSKPLDENEVFEKIKKYLTKK
ncbi:MAG TPA: response regulator, partial [Spirochaetota bacterium]|nr:response regulator [Spirochaetota bacterium]